MGDIIIFASAKYKVLEANKDRAQLNRETDERSVLNNPIWEYQFAKLWPNYCTHNIKHSLQACHECLRVREEEQIELVWIYLQLNNNL